VGAGIKYAVGSVYIMRICRNIIYFRAVMLGVFEWKWCYVEMQIMDGVFCT
jgi:hypothetical protein